MRGWAKPRGVTVNLEAIVADIAAIATRYGCTQIHGDRYSAQWVREAFRRQGLAYVDAAIRKRNAAEASYFDRSAAYLEVEPLFAQGRIALLDHPRLARELKLLERRPRSGGKTIVDHPTGQHDDHANALALAAALVAAQDRPRPALQIYAIDTNPPLVDAPSGEGGWRALKHLGPGFLRGFSGV
jgi:hypothetical protein